MLGCHRAVEEFRESRKFTAKSHKLIAAGNRPARLPAARSRLGNSGDRGEFRKGPLRALSFPCLLDGFRDVHGCSLAYMPANTQAPMLAIYGTLGL